MPDKNGPRESVNGVQRRTVLREKVMSLLVAGVEVRRISSQCSCSRNTIYKMLKDQEFIDRLEQERELISIDAIAATGQIVADAVKIVAKGIKDGDRKLAFDFLKETGVLRTTGSRIGMDQKSADSDHGLQILINISGEDIKTNDKIIDLECVENDHLDNDNNL